jgi:CubicO group peptidase (beta-lactamase class C family)
MKQFFCGLTIGLVTGIIVGVILSACGIFLYGKVVQKRDAAASQLAEKIEQKAGDLAGKYPSEAEIAELAKTYLSDRHNYGLVIGVLSNSETKIFGFGRISKTVRQAPDGDSVFEIGSITKTFTGLTLALMAQKTEIGLNDNLESVLPAEAKLPDDAGKLITLKYLASQCSGLPRLPANLSALSLRNPYKDYSTQKLYEALRELHVNKDFIGKHYEYSNFAVGLLGHILATKSGKSYDDLIWERICQPCGLQSTRQIPSEKMKGRVVQGHNNGKETPHWDFTALAGCGALYSSANDLLRYANVYLQTTDERMAEAADLATTVQFTDKKEKVRVGLGWQVRKMNHEDIVWHNGGTGGFRSFLAFSKEKKRAIVVLSNSTMSVDEIGMALAKSVLVAPQAEALEGKK